MKKTKSINRKDRKGSRRGRKVLTIKGFDFACLAPT